MEKLSKVWDNASKAHSKLEKITEGLLLSPANTDFDKSAVLNLADSVIKDMHACRRILTDHILEDHKDVSRRETIKRLKKYAKKLKW